MVIALKEWAVVCKALALGHQSIIIRKGGIHEANGVFRPEHDEFLLYPTYFHEQQRTGIKPEYLGLLDDVERDKPSAGILRISHRATVTKVDWLATLDECLMLDTHHLYTEATIRQRFQYRSPGLYCMHVNVRPLSSVLEIVERPEYAGCKSWVEIDQ